MTKRKDTYGIREMESFAMTEFKPIKEGKVREIYDNGDSLIMVATDRISAFDVILKNKVTNKGKVLTQMSKFWFDYTRDLLPNHMLSVDVKEMPEFFQQPQYEGRSMMCRKLTMLPVECIVRGYITGSGWNIYKNGGRIDVGIDAVEWAKKAESLGAGEILLTSMDCDGTKAGYDIELTRTIAESVGIPVIASGGAGTLEHFYDALTEGKADAALAASLFHYKELEIREVKEYLAGRNVPVRL